MKRDAMKPEHVISAERIINNKETKSYNKLFNELKAL